MSGFVSELIATQRDKSLRQKALRDACDYSRQYRQGKPSLQTHFRFQLGNVRLCRKVFIRAFKPAEPVTIILTSYIS